MTALQIGDRVRHSGYALQSSRDWWLQQGEPRRKQLAKDAYDKLVAERGTVSAILHNGFEIKWDNGSVSRCLSCRVEKA